VVVGDPAADGFQPGPDRYDAILCGRLLEQVRDPARLLLQTRAWLLPGGRVLARLANGRHHAVLQGLLDGVWQPPAGLSDEGDRIRFFTRREIEKLFFRAGFALEVLRPVPDSRRPARHGPAGLEVNLGRLQIRSLSPGVKEEFFASEYLIRAAPEPQPDPGLTSVVVVTHDQLDYTRQCLDSIRLYTDEPHEVIVIDNGSTDSTPDYLDALGGITLVRNATNRGFPAAANQGLRAARGRQVLLLNNDTVVTTGWLRRMLRALQADAATGLVGPCSNRVSGEQQVPGDYDGDLVGLDGFAWEWGKANDRRREETDRLVGFCLLIRREVIDAVGFLDERFGVGCFEDNDYCRRALKAGYRAVIARDAFVHHFGGRTFVGSFSWCDSFSAARNESLRHARGRWVFWMDSDDTISPDNGRKLRALAEKEPGPGLLGYVMQVDCPGPGPDGDLDMTVVDHVKLFRNLPHLRFEGRIHEQILPAIRRSGGETAWTDVFVLHSGYDHSTEGQERKKQRDLKLLHLELEDQPEHPFTLFNLGMTYADIGEYGPAVEFLTRSLRRSGEGESHVRKAYALLVYSHARLGQAEEARATCARGLSLFPEDAELRFRQAILLHESGRLAEAAAAYLKILHEPGERYFTSVDQGIRGFKARQNLALVYGDQGDWARAEEQWRLVVQEAPRYRQGWRGLAEVLLRRGKAQDASALADRLMAEDSLRAEGLQLRGRLAAAAGEVGDAKRRFREAVAACPNDPELVEVLCRFLFEHGEPAEAEAALKELLRLRPGDAAAHHNLATLYALQDRPEKAVEAYRHSLNLRPASVSTWLRLGDALRTTGRWREAAEAWKEAARLEPGNAEAAEALRRARQVLGA